MLNPRYVACHGFITLSNSCTDGLWRTPCARLAVEIYGSSNVNSLNVWSVVSHRSILWPHLATHKTQNGKFSLLLHQPPSQSRLDFWSSRTSQPFEYSVNGVDAIKQKFIQCHFCPKMVSVGASATFNCSPPFFSAFPPRSYELRRDRISTGNLFLLLSQLPCVQPYHQRDPRRSKACS